MVAVLIPTYRRVDRLDRVVSNALAPGANVYLLMEPDEACEIEGAATLTRPEGFGTYAAAINYGYGVTSERWLFAGADDLRFHEGWLAAALAVGAPVTGTNDLGNPDVLAGRHATHYLARRDYLDELGGTVDGPGTFLFEGYDHNYTDTELVEVAKLRGVFEPCLDSVVEHLHPAWGKAGVDATYGKSFRGVDRDRRLFDERMRGFRDAFRGGDSVDARCACGGASGHGGCPHPDGCS